MRLNLHRRGRRFHKDSPRSVPTKIAKSRECKQKRYHRDKNLLRTYLLKPLINRYYTSDYEL